MIENIKMMENAINQKVPQQSFNNDQDMGNSHIDAVGPRPSSLEDIIYISGSENVVFRNVNMRSIPNLLNQKLCEWVPEICSQPFR